jgi:twinkle protein
VEEVTRIREYLTGADPTQRGLKLEVLTKYGVGCATYRFPEGNTYVSATCVTFPWVMSREELDQQDKELRTTTLLDPDKALGPWITRRVKARAWQKKEWQRLDPPGGGWGLFGLHTVPAEAKEVVLTEGEYDAMAVYQATGMPAVSLPNGAGSLPLDVLPLLERFERVYLWMDNDAPGQAVCNNLSSRP